MPKPPSLIEQYDPVYGRSEELSLRVRAPIALVTNPAMSRTHRTTYPFPTHGCLRGILRTIYPHSSVDYAITRLFLMRPIQYDSFTTNEVSSFTREPFNVCDRNRRSQRRNTALFDVEWIFDFYLKMVLPPRNAGDNVAKLVKQFLVHVRDGYREQSPYVGLRENLLSEYELYPSPSKSRVIKTVAEDIDQGLMYFDHPVVNAGGDRRQPVNKSYYANISMVNGVVDYPDWRSVLKHGMVLG